MLDALEPRRVNDELLKLILTKLHRLETRLNEIDCRLDSIQFSVSEAGSSLAGPLNSTPSRRCSCSTPRPLFQSFHVDLEAAASASAYRASVDKLRDCFECDSETEPDPEDIGVASTCDDRGDDTDFVDGYSISIYPSHPVSIFSLYIHDLGPREEVPEVPALRYEDTPLPTESGCSSRRSSRAFSFSSPRRIFSTPPTMASTARTSIALSSTPGRPQSSGTASFSRLRGSIRRATCMGPSRRKSYATETGRVQEIVNDEDNTAVTAKRIHTTSPQEKEVVGLIHVAQKGVKACVFYVPRKISVLGRKVMSKQSKASSSDKIQRCRKYKSLGKPYKPIGQVDAVATTQVNNFIPLD